MNELRTQGFEIFVVTGPTAATKIGNIVQTGEFGKDAGSDIITTNLDSVAVEKITGLSDTGEMEITVNVDPASTAHQFLDTNAGTQNRMWFCVCASDGTTAPTASGSVITPPLASARSSIKFQASIKSFRYGGLSPNGVWNSKIVLALSGAITTTWKTP